MKLNEIANPKNPETERIKSVLRELGIISKSKINVDMSVDVRGNVHLKSSGYTSIPVHFQRVSGYFDISFSSISVLKGAPRYVGGDFSCVLTPLTSLRYAPQYVGGDFSCLQTSITSLVDAPLHVGNNFLCYSTSKQTLSSFHGVERWIPNIKIGGAIVVSQTHLLGLALIEGINSVLVYPPNTQEHLKFDISHHDPFQFQEQLLEHGLTEQAQL